MIPTAPFARLFVALWPDAAALRALAAWQARWAWPRGAAVVAPAQLHLTLHFIGAVPTGRLTELALGLARPMHPFELDLDRTELWPQGLAVLRPDAVPAALTALHTELQAALQQLALPVQARAFRPHVTLARRATGALPPSEPATLQWSVRGYALVQSRSGYQTLAHYP